MTLVLTSTTAERIHQSAVTPLTVHPDERGRLMEILRNDDPLFHHFGQVYMTTAYPGVVKAWHKHRKQWDYFACLHGMVKVVLFDPRPESPTCGALNQHILGVHRPARVLIPPGVWHGYMCISDHECILINCPTEVYDHAEPDEQRLDPRSDDIPYDWSRRDS